MHWPLLFLLLFAVSALAAPQAELSRVEADLKAQQELQKTYDGKQQAAKNELDGLRVRLIKATRDIQLRERALLKVAERQRATAAEIDAAQDHLQQQRKSLARLVLALQRLDRLPPQALLARPAAPVATARSFYLMQTIMPDLAAQAAAVKTSLDELAMLQGTYAKQETALRAEQAQLQARQTALESDLDKRQALLKKIGAERDMTAQRIVALSKKADSLHELMESLSKIEAEKKARSSKSTSIVATLKNLITRDNLDLPVAGQVRHGFGAPLDGGGVSQGIDIAAAGGAIVTAPGAGVVRFAGPFRQYKLLVIIQHDSGEHSLLGGMQELYTGVGDRIAGGEPVGKLPASRTQDAAKLIDKNNDDIPRSASLYYERRRNGKPIDPRNAQS